ncbi:hypothetical protein POV27_14040 [Aureisphaera galaxeae]|uniref:hypothetical protein n=1 Tax=Aureisphaera galaxeae TaxID=1538023 RepID=UPI002350B8B3|nr:hypothetical protein [Aureisphaera galaxeae]MDC8005178.1 hypothetical protein [Aureisphaera galaxeae]
MQDIVPIYKNTFGFGFYWIKEGTVLQDAVQIIFRDMGFYLKKGEIVYFSKLLEQAKARSQCPLSCKSPCCRSVLLKTPSQHVDLAMSRQELKLLDDLLKGVLFHLELREYVEKLSAN